MTGKQLTKFCLSLAEAAEDHPFGPFLDVYRIRGRIFALLVPDGEHPYVSLKCEPEHALDLRDKYEAVTPGYHLNKRHWNSVVLDGDAPDTAIKAMIRHSYDCVVAKLPKSDREELKR